MTKQYVRPGEVTPPPQTDVVQITAPAPGDYVADIIYIPGASATGGGSGQTVAYHHIQNSPSAIWNISHNLNFYPNVTTMDSSTPPQIVEGEVEHLTRNTLRVTFTSPFGGDAYLS